LNGFQNKQIQDQEHSSDPVENFKMDQEDKDSIKVNGTPAVETVCIIMLLYRYVTFIVLKFRRKITKKKAKGRMAEAELNIR